MLVKSCSGRRAVEGLCGLVWCAAALVFSSKALAAGFRLPRWFLVQGHGVVLCVYSLGVVSAKLLYLTGL